MSETLADRRVRLMGPNVPTFYDDPVHIVRGEGVWLWDADGRKYLDCYNNVPHVGHCHPHVVEAVAQQSSVLTTHTRYHHTLILDLMDRITGSLSHGLDQMILTCTGSEANDIALRMAQAVTGKWGVIATDNTYHGNTLATAQLSTRRPPIGGYPAHVRLVPAPSSLDPLGASLSAQPEAFAGHIRDAIADLDKAGIGFGAMMICPVFANEGLPALEPGFFAPAEAVISNAGGLILCDEVQPGFGRVGSHMWGHDWLGIAPDVVTLGKPMGNGYPVAGVVAQPAVMRAFREAFGYFNTFGGNPVACAAAMAMLDVLESERLQDNALRVGHYALEHLRALDHPAIAEVRGLGLFFGLEFSRPDGSPDSTFAHQVTEAMRQRGVLLNRIGRHMNTLKMRPPLPFATSHVDIAIMTLSDVLAEIPFDP
ncbi:MAG: aspartate aminotransferase family protein [Pseudomonadota bacterium]